MTDKITEETTHNKYKEYYLAQAIKNLIVGDEIIITVNGVAYYSYTAQYEKAHFDLQVQDKGAEWTEEEQVDAQIAVLQAEKLRMNE